jgi:hypothetical protein
MKKLIQGIFNLSAEDESEEEHMQEEAQYTPNRFDGEYNVWFHQKPLEIGLIPSTQIYGTWEVSSMNFSDKCKDDREKISSGDVIIAVNLSCIKAHLPRKEFADYLKKSPCPLVVTFRKPSVYGYFDSRSIVTAMFPTSGEYRKIMKNKTRFSRASSAQWKRGLQMELEKKMSSKDLEGTKKSEILKEIDTDTFHNGAISQIQQEIQSKSLKDKMSPAGEFSYTFSEYPIHLVLAPSTRIYGSVEIYDPKVHDRDIQVGDVVMAVNGDTSVSRWPTEDLMDYLSQLHPPVTVLFRRPIVYRKYVEKYFKTQKESSSCSTANSMFPDTAEYKNSKSANEKIQRQSIENLKNFSCKIRETDQFRLWVGKENGTSSFLTEKHVRFLWRYLPLFLTCNEMELIYNTRTHGWSLLSFYSQLEGKGPTLLVVKDDKDNIFGGKCFD